MPIDCRYCTSIFNIDTDYACKHGFCIHMPCGISGIKCIECIVFDNHDIDFELSDSSSYNGERLDMCEAIFKYAINLGKASIYGKRPPIINTEVSITRRFNVINTFLVGYAAGYNSWDV